MSPPRRHQPQAQAAIDPMLTDSSMSEATSPRSRALSSSSLATSFASDFLNPDTSTAKPPTSLPGILPQPARSPLKTATSPSKSASPSKGPTRALRPWPPPSETQSRLSANPALVLQNARFILAQIRESASSASSETPKPKPEGLPEIVNYESTSRYLHYKDSLFPATPVLHLETPKPRPKKGKNVKRTDRPSAESSETEIGIDVGRLQKAHEPPPQKRPRIERPVTKDEAWEWTCIIGRLVKGKARLTPELLSEVSAALDALEDRKTEFAREVLEDGLLEMVNLLAEVQESEYSLDGLRDRAQALVTAWRWIMTR